MTLRLTLTVAAAGRILASDHAAVALIHEGVEITIPVTDDEARAWAGRLLDTVTLTAGDGHEVADLIAEHSVTQRELHEARRDLARVRDALRGDPRLEVMHLHSVVERIADDLTAAQEAVGSAWLSGRTLAEAIRAERQMLQADVAEAESERDEARAHIHDLASELGMAVDEDRSPASVSRAVRTTLDGYRKFAEEAESERDEARQMLADLREQLAQRTRERDAERDRLAETQANYDLIHRELDKARGELANANAEIRNIKRGDVQPSHVLPDPLATALLAFAQEHGMTCKEALAQAVRDYLPEAPDVPPESTALEGRALVEAVVRRLGSNKKVAAALGLTETPVARWRRGEADIPARREAQLRGLLGATHA